MYQVTTLHKGDGLESISILKNRKSISRNTTHRRSYNVIYINLMCDDIKVTELV